MRKYVLVFFIILTPFFRICAQTWNESDSIWLNNILSGKDSLIIDPEFQKAIEGGTLIKSSEPVGKLLEAPSQLLISKDFSEYLSSEQDTSLWRNYSLLDLPPAVVMLKSMSWKFGLEAVTNYPHVRIPTYEITNGARSPFPENGWNLLQPFLLQFDGAALLSYMFSKTYRQRLKNQKTAVAWKNYNSFPSEDLYSKQKTYRESKESERLPLPDIIPIKRDTVSSKN